MPFQSEEVACADCGASFIKRTPKHTFCSDRCRWRAREKHNPKLVVKNRDRCARWYASKTCNSSKSQPWLLGAPSIGDYLPGGAMSITVSPEPRWRVEHRNVRGLHGMVTSLTGVPHGSKHPRFILIPTDRGCGWGMYLPEEELARKLASRKTDAVLFGRPVVVECGALHRIKAPRVTKRGRRRIRIDMLTPVCLRNHTHSASYRSHVVPAGNNLVSVLTAWHARRLGLQLDDAQVPLKLIERVTEPRRIQIGGHIGTVIGFIGYLVVETNAIGEWLLRVCETTGLGGRCAYGFGRFKVSDA